MTVNQLLPTLSEILAKEGLETSLDFYSATKSACPSNPYTAYYTGKRRLKAEREWCGAVDAVNQLLKEIIINPNRERSAVYRSEVRKKELTPATGRETLTDRRSPPTPKTTPDNRPFACQGLVISGPCPILIHPALALNFATQVFIPQIPGWEGFSVPTRQTLPLLPMTDGGETSVPPTFAFPLLPEDPQAKEPFCIVLTSRFSLVMVLGEDGNGRPAFQFSFDPDVVEQALELLRKRTRQIDGKTPLNSSEGSLDPATVFESWIGQFPGVNPHYKTVTKFTRFLLNGLPLDSEKPREAVKRLNPSSQPQSQSQSVFVSVSNPAHSHGHLPNAQPSAEGTFDASQVELIQAVAHEIRTPLATIRTLTRLLLKAKNLNPEIVRKRLEMIDHECTTQIDRFNLIFRAVELELSQAKPTRENQAKPCVQLTPMSLGDIFESSLPRWQKQASQRNHTLEVSIPQKLPNVVSDPTMLDQVLTGVIENFTRSLPSGSHIQVEVRLAGHQLKLQLESQCKSQQSSPFEAAAKSSLKSFGRLLMFQPETGALSLNMTVTKNLFEALGGKLIVRQRPQQGKTMTIFLPLKS